MDGAGFDAIAKIFAEHRLSRRQALTRGATGVAAGALAAAGLTGVAGAQLAPAGAVAPAASEGLPQPVASLPSPELGTFTMLEVPMADATAVATPATEATKETMFLFLQTFESGSLVPKPGSPGGYTLTLRKGLGETVYFSDRPQKIVGTMPTPKFLDALGFPPDNPPNAALIGHRSASHKDIVVLELFNPKYDTSSNTATYDVKLLQDWHKLDETFEQTPDDAKQLPRDFTAAHLFIDDCADRDMICVDEAKNLMGTFRAQGMCFDFWRAGCVPCQNYAPKCNNTFPACKGRCHVFECYSAYGGGGYCG